ncbi:MAG: hypothetical protein ACKVWV_11120 [Planctomycetota bacterium]
MAATRRTTTTRTARDTRATSRIADKEADDAEAAPAESKVGLAESMIMITTILLVAALVLTDYALGKHFGEGMLFK